jgi:hypothetical protein
MPADQEVINFIRASFRSIWSMELLLLLKSDPEKCWSQDELVTRLRGSDSVVAQGIESLVAGGLVALSDNEEACYAPASEDIRRLSSASEDLYRRKPDAVRRIIVLSSSDQLSAFADAFRLKGE